MFTKVWPIRRPTTVYHSGASSTFACTVLSSCEASVQWLKDGCLMEQGLEFAQTHDRVSGQCLLFMDESYAEDAGIVTCRASNLYGTDETECRFHVTRKSQLNYAEHR